MKALLRPALNGGGLLALAALLVAALQEWPQALPEKPQPVGTQPDYVIVDFHAVDLDETGRLRYELTAERLRHFPSPERARLEMPELVFYRTATVADGLPAVPDPWRMTATEGLVTRGGDRLLLRGDVHVERQAEAPLPAMTLDTDWLLVYGRKETAETDAPVQVRSDLAKLTSVGLHADLAAGKLQLRSEVRGRYDPP